MITPPQQVVQVYNRVQHRCSLTQSIKQDSQNSKDAGQENKNTKDTQNACKNMTIIWHM